MQHEIAKYLTGPETERRYKITRMTLYRWQHDATLGFPQPLVINRRKLWAIAALDAWDAARQGAAA